MSLHVSKNCMLLWCVNAYTCMLILWCMQPTFVLCLLSRAGMHTCEHGCLFAVQVACMYSCLSMWCACVCDRRVHCGCYSIRTAHGPYHLAANRGLRHAIVALRTAVV